MEIVERSSGYWIVDEHGAVDGPFIELEEAQSQVVYQLWQAAVTVC